jgi:energy-coupling factor transporter transmembrane protein EcfT
VAELNIFHYEPGKSVLHGMDARIKLPCMILFTVAAGFTNRMPGLAAITGVLALALLVAGLPVKKMAKEIRYFLFLIAIVILAHALSVPGPPLPWLPLRGLSRAGLRSGVLFGWRLVLVITTCAVLTGTTTLAALKSAIEWYLRPVPLIPQARVATMFSLTFTLIPLVFDQASEMLDAQKARCAEGRRNPAARLMFLAFPLLLQSFIRADEMALAMESRCYSEDRAGPVFKTNGRDWLLLVFSALVCGGAVLG